MVSDHASLRYILTMRDPTNRIARWLVFLQAMTSQLSTGENQHTQTLMRCLEPASSNEDATTPSSQTSVYYVTSRVMSDPVGINTRAQSITQQPEPQHHPSYAVSYHQASTTDGLLYHIMRLGYRRQPDRRSPAQLQLSVVVPKPLRKLVLTTYHADAISAHAGVNATYDNIRQTLLSLCMIAFAC